MLRRCLAAALALAMALCGLNALAEAWEIVGLDSVEEAVAQPEWAALPEEELVLAPEAEESVAEVELLELAPVEGLAANGLDAGAVKIDKTTFPDAAFRKYVTGLDGDGDGMLSGVEADMAVIIDVTGLGIASLGGIECFGKLEYLYCQKNKLTELDVSRFPSLKHLDCRDNRIKKLVLGKRSALEYLDCGRNKLKTLDVSGCRALTELNCARNQIAKLNLNGNVGLVRLDCQQNSLTSIEVAGNKALMALMCQENKIRSIDIRKLPEGLRDLARREDLNKWNDDIHFWFGPDLRCLILPADTQVTEGKKLLYKKDHYLKHKKVKRNRGAFRKLSDAQFANFRECKTTGMGRHALYRGSTPLHDVTGRVRQAMKAVEDAGIRTIINLSEDIDQVVESSHYAGSYYAGTAIWAKGLGLDEDVLSLKGRIGEGCAFMAEHEGPYFIHCAWGKDRTGIMCAILECLMGASASEVIRDYETTFFNFYGIREGSETSEYIAYVGIRHKLAWAFGVRSILDRNVDLAACAEKYLLESGLSEEQIAALKGRLAANY